MEVEVFPISILFGRTVTPVYRRNLDPDVLPMDFIQLTPKTVEMRRRASGVVEKHWGRILALADVLDARAELSREEVLVAARWIPKGPPGPPALRPAAAVLMARCD